MRVTVHVDYRTTWGESIHIIYKTVNNSRATNEETQAMTISGSEHWTAVLDVDASMALIEYNFLVKTSQGIKRIEWGTPHKLALPCDTDECVVYDCWHDKSSDKPFYSSAFLDAICCRPQRNEPVLPQKGSVQIRVNAPMVLPGQTLALVGASASLGAWDASQAVRMSDAHFPEWTVNLPSAALAQSTECKFVVLGTESGDVASWECGPNRVLPPLSDGSAATVLAGLCFQNHPFAWKGAGTAIPVFSIRTGNDFGVGDFAGLKKMADWCMATGQNVLQILPINDTTMTHKWTDSYPYNANSTFALHPLYLSLNEMGKLKDQKRQNHYMTLANELNALEAVDYERVTNGKLAFAREMFEQKGKKVMATKAFKQFFAQNSHWLKPYAAFCVLRDRNGTPDFNEWGDFANYDEAMVTKFIEQNQCDADFVYYLQFNLHLQMLDAKAYANSRGVAIKGDIPIGISRTSVDAWLYPRLFNMDCQAGAPPDDFSVLGQNWGFPTYNWEEMSRDGFAWWKERFRKMAEYFDAYRIDHVLGFFRIWEIPMDALHGLLGVFSPARPFSPEELYKNYKFSIELPRHTEPLINDAILDELAGKDAQEVKEHYLIKKGNGEYRLKSEFDTQRKVADYFAEQKENEKNHRVCNALLDLLDDVLFIEDRREKGKFHPRIAAQQTFSYKYLSDDQKRNFDRLCEDFFYHRHNDFWREQAMRKLPAITGATNMLACAEDLGMIPACVPDVLRQLEILSLEIQRMPKEFGVEFADTWRYPYFSVCSTSTHDMGGIRLWWEEDRKRTQRFYNEALRCQGEAPFTAEPWICKTIVQLNLQSTSMLCILPLQDWLSMYGYVRRNDAAQEQINVPSNPRHYWRYRMHVTVDELLHDSALISSMKQLILESGR